MTTEYKSDAEQNLVEITVDGKVTAADFDRIIPEMESFIKAQGKRINILEIITDFDGFEWPVLGKGVAFDIKHLKDFGHCAVVTDKGWLGPFARLVSSVTDCEVRVFKPDEVAEAREWLKAA